MNNEAQYMYRGYARHRLLARYIATYRLVVFIGHVEFAHGIHSYGALHTSQHNANTTRANKHFEKLIGKGATIGKQLDSKPVAVGGRYRLATKVR